MPFSIQSLLHTSKKQLVFWLFSAIVLPVLGLETYIRCCYVWGFFYSAWLRFLCIVINVISALVSIAEEVLHCIKYATFRLSILLMGVVCCQFLDIVNKAPVNTLKQIFL